LVQTYNLVAFNRWRRFLFELSLVISY